MSYQQQMSVSDKKTNECSCDQGNCVADWREKISRRFSSGAQYLIPILQYIQSEAGYLPPQAMQAAAKYLRAPESKIYGVASFYAQFHFEPQGKHTVTVCRGTACHVGGSGRLVEEIEKHLDIKAGGTTHDMLFTLETVACVGACALAPLVVIDNNAHGRQTSLSLKKTIDKIKDAENPQASVKRKSTQPNDKLVEKPLPKKVYKKPVSTKSKKKPDKPATKSKAIKKSVKKTKKKSASAKKTTRR